MSDEISAAKIIPSAEGFKSFALLGGKVALGMAATGLIGTFVGSKVKSPIPYVSSRTLGSAASMLVLYTGYRMSPTDSAVKDILKYATAGSSIYTAGSLVFDIIALTKIQVPAMLSYAIASATGVAPNQTQQEGSAVDLNTEFS